LVYIGFIEKTVGGSGMVIADTWEKIGAIDFVDFQKEINQSHCASKIAGLWGGAYSVHQDDWSELSLSWESGALISGPIEGGHTLKYDPAKLTLKFLNGFLEDSSTYQFHSKTIDDAVSWLKEMANGCGLDSGKINLDKSKFPDGPVKDGEPFTISPSSPELLEMTRYYTNAAIALTKTQEDAPNPTPVRIWPHHFDMDTVQKFGGEYKPEAQVGRGFSPGDGSYSEPYFYVNLWPYPTLDEIMEITGPGFWHKKGWTGRVLTASEIKSQNDAQTQMETTLSFLNLGYASCEKLLRL
jgi:hypothetical protein